MRTSIRASLIGGIAAFLVACGAEGASPASDAALTSEATATASATVEPTEVASPIAAKADSGTVSVSSVTPTEPVEAAATRFGAALVSGDLTALTLAFAPSGLIQARALAAQAGDAAEQEIVAATIASVEPTPGATGSYIVRYALETPAGPGSLGTRWQWLPAGWRIVGIEPGP